MIAIPRRDLAADVQQALLGYQRAVDGEPGFSAQVERAAKDFKKYNARQNPTFAAVRRTLDEMCSGARRCMYCEDSCADEVEHFRPKNLYPDFVFVWKNYLYACGPCNSPKSNRFAVLSSGGEIIELKGSPIKGKPALIHPREEDPLEFLTLDIAGDTFRFVADNERADYTIKLLGLNDRDYLPRARREAYGSYRARIIEFAKRRDSGDSAESLNALKEAVLKMQHPTVWHEMRRQVNWIPELTTLFREVPEALTW